ncbi:MAG: DUF177 domain-containing protein [Clostridia bacterium]|nr:DUF177 domain-containing protein [Clostridia bacterium]
MKQDISSIVTNNGGKISFHGKSVISSVTFCGSEYSFPEGMELSGEIAKSAGDFIVNATVSGKVSTLCARCGKPVTEDFSFEMQETLVKDKASCANDDAIVFTGNEIDLGALALDSFFVNTSSRYLCNEECKGLCPVCGINLNEKECDCTTQASDPRFDILNNLEF